MEPPTQALLGAPWWLRRPRPEPPTAQPTYSPALSPSLSPHLPRAGLWSAALSTPTEPSAGPGRGGARRRLFGAGDCPLPAARCQGAGPAPRSGSERQRLTHARDPAAAPHCTDLCAVLRPGQSSEGPSLPCGHQGPAAWLSRGSGCKTTQQGEHHGGGGSVCSCPPPSFLERHPDSVPPASAPGRGPATEARHGPLPAGAASEMSVKCRGEVCWGSFRGKCACRMEPPALFCL